MRTHARYELQDSASVEEPPASASLNPGELAPPSRSLDSPHPGSLSSGAGPSRSISSESADPPMPTHPLPPLPLPPTLQRQQPTTKPPSPMDTEEEDLGVAISKKKRAVREHQASSMEHQQQQDERDLVGGVDEGGEPVGVRRGGAS